MEYMPNHNKLVMKYDTPTGVRFTFKQVVQSMVYEKLTKKQNKTKQTHK